ncbi:MAG: hypothetical protein FWF71_02125 [Actinomycetia bacterium]|nr:hypothetical protein [Actinomycetes bacterium]
MELLAGVLGGLAGVLGFLPFLLVGGKIRRRFIEQGTKVLKYIMLLPILSFVLMIAAMLVCWLVAVQYLLVFGLVCVAVFILAMIVFVVVQMKK